MADTMIGQLPPLEVWQHSPTATARRLTPGRIFAANRRPVPNIVVPGTIITLIALNPRLGLGTGVILVFALGGFVVWLLVLPRLPRAHLRHRIRDVSRVARRTKRPASMTVVHVATPA
jgi:hypothetical protein